MPDHPIFTVGGTVQAGGGIYLPRPADDELLAHCLAGDFCYVLTARQMGKSSLMVRTAERLREQERQAVIIDLTRLGTSLQAEQWYLGLIDEIVEQLDLDIDYRAGWEKHAHLGATQRLSRFLRDELLAALAEPLVIFIDEIDTTLSLPFSDDFFAAIRACYNARSTDPAYKRLSFVLLGVATPGDLIRDPQRTPFNIGTRIDLTDFTLEQAMPLAEGFDLPNQQSKIETLKSVLSWTNGHPYLTQRLCRALLERNQAEWNETAIAQVVEQTFFGEKSKQDTNLGFVRDMLTLRAPERYKLTVLQLLRDIHKGRKIKDEEQAIPKMHLKLAGIVRREGEALVLRNQIYARVFDPKWLKQNWPVSIKQRFQSVGYAMLALLFGIAATAVVFFYGADLRGHLFHLQNGWTHESPVKPFQDASGTKMVRIPGGTFEMGGDPEIALLECKKYYEETSCEDLMRFWQAESPIHPVTLDGFAMDIYEVTNAQYRACVEAGVCDPPENDRSYERLRYYNDPFYNNYPVIYVSWENAHQYCSAWRGARLPTEAEWEFAARGGLEGQNYPWGDVFEDGQANFCDTNCSFDYSGKPDINDGYPDTSPVGSYPPNAYGLYDMAGNVWEWVDDWYDAYPGNTIENSDYGTTYRVVRGGGWTTLPSILRVSVRSRYTPDIRSNYYLGFRCARSP
jgi:formylglycine-generating enzyme required for sulfatase activity